MQVHVLMNHTVRAAAANRAEINKHKANMIVVFLKRSLNYLLMSKRKELHQGATLSLIGRSDSFDFKHGTG